MAYDIARGSRPQGIILLFKVFDQQRQKLDNAAFLGGTIALSQQHLKSSRVAFVLFFRVDDVRQHISEQFGVLVLVFNLGRARHFFQSSLSYSAWVSRTVRSS